MQKHVAVEARSAKCLGGLRLRSSSSLGAAEQGWRISLDSGRSLLLWLRVEGRCNVGRMGSWGLIITDHS